MTISVFFFPFRGVCMETFPWEFYFLVPEKEREREHVASTFNANENIAFYFCPTSRKILIVGIKSYSTMGNQMEKRMWL